MYIRALIHLSAKYLQNCQSAVLPDSRADFCIPPLNCVDRIVLGLTCTNHLKRDFYCENYLVNAILAIIPP